MTAKDDREAADAARFAEDSALLNELDMGFMKSQALFTWGKLGIADVLRDGPKTSTEVAVAIGAQEPLLRRLLLALSLIGIVTEDDAGRFHATSLGARFATDHPRSVRNWSHFRASRYAWQPWCELAQAVKTGKPAFDLLYGVPMFTYLAEHPEDAAVFHAGASSIARVVIPQIIDAYDFSPFKTIVDVGGGHGTLLRGILERHENARGILCDLPGTIAQAHDLRESSVSTRCELVGSDMFASVPAGGDAYVMKQVLHDFNDDEVIRVLRNIRGAISASGRLIIIEHLIHDDQSPNRWFDLLMMVMLTGRERTKDEFGEIYRQAGFRLERTIKTAGGVYWLLEGVPV